MLKLLVEEAGSEYAERVWNEPDAATASRLVVPEVGAALSAARRAGRLGEEAQRRALREWGRFRIEVDVLELTPEIADRAAELAAAQALSGADAVHLASALSLADCRPLVVTWDRRLASAAFAAGLDVAPPAT